MPAALLLTGDAKSRLRSLPSGKVACCVTSPPYWGLRDYGHDGQIGLEDTPEAYVSKIVDVFREVRRVLRDDGTLWLNLGDSYAGSGPSGASYKSKTTLAREGMASDGAFRISTTLAQRGLTYAEKKPVPPPGLKSKDLIGIPWRVAFALQADGWWLRQDIIWHKPNPMPESVRDRCTKAHEYLFLLSKSQSYYFDSNAMQEPANTTDQTRNRRSVWTVSTKPFKGAHFATFPPNLIEPCVLAGSRPSSVVLDPFGGSGTTAVVALNQGRSVVSIELNPAYTDLSRQRLVSAGYAPTLA